MDSLPPGASLTRKELQWYMKQWGQPANGKTEAMREEYDRIRITSCTLDGDARSAPVGRPPASASKAVSSKPASVAGQSPSPKKEKRLRPYRNTCSAATRQRIERALSQRLYLVRRGDVSATDAECEFVVLGSTGNVYTVRIGHLPSCSCPDSAKGHHCKHILFVLLKVMGLDPESPYVYQAALLTTELQDMFASMANRRVGGVVMANAQVQQAYASLQQGGHEPADSGVARKSLEGDHSDCPICFDPMTSSSSLTYCRAMCGTNFHADCIRRWCAQQKGRATCPNCRQPWEEDSSANQKEGYTNLGRMQGQSPIRDTSTYSTWFGSPYAKRRRYGW